jgi:hypothetical protein
MATEFLSWLTVESDLSSAVSPLQVDTAIIRTNTFRTEMNITNNLNDKIDVLLNLVTDMTKITQHMINQQLHSPQVPIYVSPSSMSLLTDFNGDEDEFVAKNWLTCTENIITMNKWHSGLAVACIQPHMKGAAIVTGFKIKLRLHHLKTSRKNFKDHSVNLSLLLKNLKEC